MARPAYGYGPANKPNNRLQQVREQLDGKGHASATPATYSQQPTSGGTSTPPMTTGVGVRQETPTSAVYTPPYRGPGIRPNPVPGGHDVHGNPGSENQDALMDEFTKKLLKGGLAGGDTAEMEALLHQLFGDQLGAEQVGQRASMGRAGFASSGALGAMESDAQRKAAQAEQQARLGLRTSENQRAIDNALAGGGADLDRLRLKLEQEHEANQQKNETARQKSDDDLLQMMIDLMAGDEAGAPGVGAGEAGTNPDGSPRNFNQPKTDINGDGKVDNRDTDAYYQRLHAAADNAPVVDPQHLPQGAKQLIGPSGEKAVDRHGNAIYILPDGSIVVVKETGFNAGSQVRAGQEGPHGATFAGTAPAA